MVAHSKTRMPVGLIEERIHLGLFKIVNRGFCRLLEWYRPYLGTPGQVDRRMRADETCQGMNSRKPLVTGCLTASAITFQMVQEFASDFRCQLLHGHTIDGATALLACK